jgi:hypothetical protein
MTLELAEPVTDKPILGKPLEVRRPKRSFSKSSKEVSYKIPVL